jgi:hypothetical protein
MAPSSLLKLKSVVGPFEPQGMVHGQRVTRNFGEEVVALRPGGRFG